MDFAREEIQLFLEQWTSHNQELHTYGNIFHRRFLALFVDESQSSMASGCSIDKSVRFVSSLGEALKIDFFNRLQYGYFKSEEEIEVLPQNDFISAYNGGEITGDTLVFDHLVKTKGDFLENWVRPLQETWLSRIV